MSNTNQSNVIYLARHGETPWASTGQHTGLTDLPLTERGEDEARKLGQRLRGMTFAKVLTSPLQRATRTCELAGFESVRQIDPDLVEWNYGQYEGLTPAQIHAKQPGWNVFRDGSPGGESPQQVAARADRVVCRLRAELGDVLLFSSRHFLQALTLRWLGVEPMDHARALFLSTCSLSALGYKTDRSDPVIRLWNETQYLSR